VKTVPLPSLSNPTLPVSNRHRKCISVASQRFLPQNKSTQESVGHTVYRLKKQLIKRLVTVCSLCHS
jgi:hypothetical protein